MSERQSRYETWVHHRAVDHHLGTLVIVYAPSATAAVERAVQVGWRGPPSDARVKIVRVEDVLPTPQDDE